MQKKHTKTCIFIVLSAALPPQTSVFKLPNRAKNAEKTKQKHVFSLYCLLVCLSGGSHFLHFLQARVQYKLLFWEANQATVQ